MKIPNARNFKRECRRFLIRSMKRRHRYPSNQGVGRLCWPRARRIGSRLGFQPRHGFRLAGSPLFDFSPARDHLNDRCGRPRIANAKPANIGERIFGAPLWKLRGDRREESFTWEADVRGNS
ncbi:hypothetical protein PUN28_000860 [Cardiocondyla obscurior]|uniref:Uncharacterized protein n=1 Tax=Cardiocondyla obscurior TaxID=286306 RepID=A0AAW2H1Z6_9HYME